MDRWAKALVLESRRPEAPVRNTAAWAMAYDPGRPEFVERLRELVAGDESILVRRNAACSLAKSNDAAGRPVLRSMFDQFTVTAPAAGVVSALPGVGVSVQGEKAIATVKQDDGTVIDVVAAVPGRVAKTAAATDARVAPGDPLVVLEPDGQHALNAAVALALVGTEDDLPVLGLAAAPQSQFGDDVKAAARAAVDAIRARSK
jgi:HEAT repeat protein